MHQQFYNENVLVNINSSIEIAKFHQSEPKWLNERKKRITASNAYALYTYAKNKIPNWQKKIENLIFPKKYKLINCEYGKNTEAEAKIWYEKLKDQKMANFGLVIHPNASFLGCSPDGCIIAENKLIEIKCPISGKLKTVEMMLKEIHYLIETPTGYKLKKKHAYYGQVQLNLLIMDLKKCDFIIYSQFSKCGYIVEIEFDSDFCKNYFNVLKDIYFKQYLPVLMNHC